MYTQVWSGLHTLNRSWLSCSRISTQHMDPSSKPCNCSPFASDHEPPRIGLDINPERHSLRLWGQCVGDLLLELCKTCKGAWLIYSVMSCLSWIRRYNYWEYLICQELSSLKTCCLPVSKICIWVVASAWKIKELDGNHLNCYAAYFFHLPKSDPELEYYKASSGLLG